MQPFVPPLGFAHLAPLDGRLGPEPAHFVVEEIPAYSPSGSGDHLYLFVEKESHNTQDVAKVLAHHFRVPMRDVGFAGMKDRNAITRQWFSLPRPKEEPTNDLPPGIRIVERSYHKNKLRTGHLIGNRFVLTVSETSSPLSDFEARLSLLENRGYGNYFGPQRFGRDGKNLEKSLAWARGEIRSPKDEKLLSSVLQSELFNRMAARRLALGRVLLRGEVVRLRGTGTHFVVEDLEKETPRAESGDILSTLPMWGPKTLQSNDEARVLEEEIIAELGLDDAMLGTLARSAPGARRDLRVYPTETSVVAGESTDSVVLRFTLPSGSFATEVLREVLHTPWQNPRGAAQANAEEREPEQESPA